MLSKATVAHALLVVCMVLVFCVFSCSDNALGLRTTRRLHRVPQSGLPFQENTEKEISSHIQAA